MFKCDKCGICCRNIGNIEDLRGFDNGNGECIYLTANNLCKIYDRRPSICNVDLMYDILYKYYMTKEEYYKLNEESCHALKAQLSNKK